MGNIPYTINGQQKNYIPDFIVRVDGGRSLSGFPPSTMPGHGAAWTFIEISDPWDAKNTIRATIAPEVVVS